MLKQVRRVVRAIGILVGIGGVLLGVASAFGLPILNAGPWFEEHGRAGWNFALFVVAAAATVWTLLDRALADRDQQLADRGQQLADRGQQLADRDQQLAVAREKLGTRLEPTLRDKNQFDALLKEWNWGSGPLAWLSNGFNGKAWRASDSTPIQLFVDDWRERYFDDEEVQSAYSTFYSAVDEFTDWMATESYTGANVEQRIVPDGDERRDRGGWPAFNKVRDAGLHAAGKIADSRRSLEQVGRDRGL